VIEHDVRGSASHQGGPPISSPGRTAYVVQQVVRDGDAMCLTAWMAVVISQDVETRGGMPDDVEAERDVFDGAPVAHPARVARREHDGIAWLCGQPVVLHDVSLDDHAPSVLQFEDVLDTRHRRGPVCAR